MAAARTQRPRVNLGHRSRAQCSATAAARTKLEKRCRLIHVDSIEAQSAPCSMSAAEGTVDELAATLPSIDPAVPPSSPTDLGIESTDIFPSLTGANGRKVANQPMFDRSTDEDLGSTWRDRAKAVASKPAPRLGLRTPAGAFSVPALTITSEGRRRGKSLGRLVALGALWHWATWEPDYFDNGRIRRALEDDLGLALRRRHAPKEILAQVDAFFKEWWGQQSASTKASEWWRQQSAFFKELREWQFEDYKRVCNFEDYKRLCERVCERESESLREGLDASHSQHP